jgi:hypothetical protein
MIRRLFQPSNWQQLLRRGGKRERIEAVKEAIAGRSFKHVEALEARIAPASVATLSGGNISVLGDDGVPGVEALVFTISGSDLVITDSTSPITAGVGFTQNGANQVTVPLASFTGSLLVDTGIGADTVSLNSALNSNRRYHEHDQSHGFCQPRGERNRSDFVDDNSRYFRDRGVEYFRG